MKFLLGLILRIDVAIEIKKTINCSFIEAIKLSHKFVSDAVSSENNQTI